MKPPTIEQLRDHMPRQAEGLRLGEEMQFQEASQRSEAEKWQVADMLMTGIDPERSARIIAICEPIEKNGLVLAQARFAKIRALQ